MVQWVTAEWTTIDRWGKVMKTLVKMMEVLVLIVVAMMAPAAFRRHRERGGESPLLLLLP